MKASLPFQIFSGLLMWAAIFTFVGCGNENAGNESAEPVTEEVSLAPTADNSQTSIDFAGTYKGVTPCADCEGIEVELTINMDSTYSLSNKYLGKGDGKPIVKTGTFTWSADGSTIELNGIPDGPSKFKVGEGRLWQLDMQGNKVEGDLADKYILTKQ